MAKPIEIINKGSIGIITDGDALTRPKGSCDTLTNFDYDTENNLIKTRNNTVSADLLDGFTMPDGYEIMVGGLQTFSFNAPIDRQVVLLFVRNVTLGAIKIYVSAWFNPPPANSEEPFKTNDYENFIGIRDISGWVDEWQELTEYHGIVDFAITTPLTFTADDSALPYAGTNAYRGWFVWNATKWNSDVDNRTKNESFVCIEAYNNGIFTIQNRETLTFNELGWSDGDECYLVRYPFIVHSAQKTTLIGSGVNLNIDFSPIGDDWLIKTATSIVGLIGEEGNLKITFINKDTHKETGYIEEFIVSSVIFNPANQNDAMVSGEPTSIAEHTIDVNLVSKTDVTTLPLSILNWVITPTETSFDVGSEFPNLAKRFIGDNIRISGVASGVVPNLNGDWVVINVREDVPIANRTRITISHNAISGTVASGGSNTLIVPNVVNWRWEKRLDGGAYELLVEGNSHTFTRNNLNGQWLYHTTQLNIDYALYDNIKVRFISINFNPSTDASSIEITISKILQGTATLNQHKRYGWWLDYQQYPIMPLEAKVSDTASNLYYLSEKLGVKIEVTQEVSSSSKLTLFGLTATLDQYQKIALFKGLNLDLPTDKGYRIKILHYHGYTRRITGYQRFGNNATSTVDDVWGFIDSNNQGFYSAEAERTLYAPVYGFTVMNTILMTDPNADGKAEFDGSTLETALGYAFNEPIFTADSLGVYSGDILLTAGSIDRPDRVSFSLIQDGVPVEDIFPLQNRKNVGGSDKDKLASLNVLGNKIVGTKNNSLHTLLPIATGDGFRSLGSISKVGTQYKKTIIETSLGLLFANEDGIFLYNLDKPINILEGYRLQEYYALDKSLMFAEWHSTRKEAWFYVGGGKVWILNISNKGQIGWNDYQFPASWDIIDFISDEDKNFYIVRSDGVTRFLKDNEITNGFDVGNVGIPYDYKQNFELIDNTRGRRFKVIENKIYCKLEARDGLVPDGNIETVNVEFYKNGETTPFLTKAIKINASNTLPQTIVVRNTVSNSHRTYAIRVHGTLNFLKRLSISEVYSRAILLTQQIKEGIYEQPLIQ